MYRFCRGDGAEFEGVATQVFAEAEFDGVDPVAGECVLCAARHGRSFSVRRLRSTARE